MTIKEQEDGNIVYLHWCGDYTGVYTFIKTDQTLYLKYVRFILCKLYYIEVDFFKVKVGSKGYHRVQMWLCFNPE